MPDTTAHTHNMVDERPGHSVGQLNVTFDGRTFTLPRLIEHVRNLESAQDQIVGESNATEPEVEDPHISARFDAPLNVIALRVGDTDDLFFDRDATFLVVDELLAALKDQAKNGGLA